MIMTVFTCCHSSKQQQNDETVPAWQELALTRLGSPYDSHLNESGDYVLVFKKFLTRSQDPYPTVRFFIFDIDHAELIYENTEPGGEVKWESDDVVVVRSKIIIPNPDHPTNDEHIYRYHVKNRKKYSGKFFKNKSPQ